jgi:hypothetical protein
MSRPKTPAKDIYVCQAGSCLRRGSQAVLLEIEELANAVDSQCQVKGSGCLGLCSQAPNAIVLDPDENHDYHVRIDSLAKSAAVVLSATGKKPSVDDDPELQKRLGGVRALREREYAVTAYRWCPAPAPLRVGGGGLD